MQAFKRQLIVRTALADLRGEPAPCMRRYAGLHGRFADGDRYPRAAWFRAKCHDILTRVAKARMFYVMHPTVARSSALGMLRYNMRRVRAHTRAACNKGFRLP